MQRDVKGTISQVIKTQILVLGKDTTFGIVRIIGGISVDGDGNVSAISGDEERVLQKTMQAFVMTTGQDILSEKT